MATIARSTACSGGEGLLSTPPWYIIFDMYMHKDMEVRMAGDPRPIGYWLKHLDRLIEDTFDRTLADDNLSRRHWQTLNALASGPATSAELNAALEPFTGNDPRALAPVIDALTRRGWVRAEAEGRQALTVDGAAAHQRIRKDVDQARRLILRHVTTEEYAQVIDILQRMAAGLEPAAA
jgi:DNA-binding MarR family transcriptional regulator